MTPSSSRWVFLLAVLILLFPFLPVKAGDAFLPLFFEGKAVAGNKAAGLFQDTLYLPLSFFSDCLHTAVIWDEETGAVQLQAGSYPVAMQVASTEVTWGSEKGRLSAPPRQSHNDLWLPVEVAFHLGVEGQTRGEQLFLAWKDNYLLSVRNIIYQGRPAFLFRTAREFAYEAFLLQEPARLVIDFIGVKPYPPAALEPEAGPPVAGIRSGRFSEERMRVVFDLSHLVGYRIWRSADTTELTVVFDSFLVDAGCLPGADNPLVYVDTSHPVDFRTALLLEPHRVVVDIWDATLVGEALSIAGDGNWVERIRISQFDRHIIRIVLDVKEPRSCAVAASRSIPNRLEIKTVQEITGIDWDHEQKRLKIISTGQLQEEIRKTPGGGLAIELRHAVLSKTGTYGAGRHEGIQVSQQEPAGVRVEINRPEHQNYQVEFKSEKREMILTITPSPLSGKVILLDPGHGGIDAGAIGSRGVREKEVNLEVALHLKKYLEEAGARVIMTRDDDRYIGLYERAAVANRVGAVLGISLHANFHPNPRIHGLEVFHHPDRAAGRRLAQSILKQAAAGTKQQPLAVKVSKELVFTRETQMPSVLVEMGFLSNYQEETLLGQSRFREKLAAGIFQGIVNYFAGQ